MTTRKFSTVRRRVAGYCLPVVALAVLAAPGLAWGQTGDCNASSNIAKNPFKVYALGETVSVRYTFGAGTLSPGLSLTVNDATTYVALDCDTALSGTNRENCLGFNGVPAADAADDGDAITYAGNLTFGNVDAGDACSGLNFTAVNHGDGAPPEADPNVLVFQADGPIVFDEGESCFVQFDAVVNGIGLPANWDVGNQIVNAAAGFTGACGPALGASSTQSTAYEVQVTPEIDLKKYVSIDGGATWFDANDPPYPVGVVPSTTAQYRLVVENTGEEPLTNVVINDNTPPLNLGLVNVPLPADCLVDGYFPVGVPCTIESGDSGFGGLGNPPVQVCLTEGPKTNLACADGEGAASGGPVNACDPATVQCDNPEVTVTKTGPPLAKVGDEVIYTICATNTGSVDLELCSLTDTLLGGPTPFAPLLVPGQQVCNDYPRTVLPADPDPLPNIATVTCDVVGSASQVNDSDNHDVNLFQPSITVTKNGEAEGKVGDEVCYDIWYDNTSSADTPPLTCTGNDTLLGDLGVFTDGVVKQFCRFIVEGDPDPLPNTATITCAVDGWDNGLPAPASDNHNVDLFTVGANLTKLCRPDPVAVGETVYWDITVNNTGEKAITCNVTDPDAGIIAPVVLNVPAGASATIDPPPSKIVEEGDRPTVDNTATANCTVDGYDNVLDPLTASDSCEVPPDVEELCRTPGFWKAHAGVEKDGRSNNLTQAVIDYNGGTLGEICGVEITDTSTYDYVGTGYDISNGYNSAVEGMCVHPKQRIVRQLQRQLIAAAINCVVSGGSADCTGLLVGDNWKAANASCLAEDGEMSSWVDEIDDFNNGEGDYTCTPNIQDSIVFDGWTGPKLPGPAGSSWACGAATSNDFYLVPLPSGVDP